MTRPKKSLHCLLKKVIKFCNGIIFIIIVTLIL